MNDELIKKLMQNRLSISSFIRAIAGNTPDAEDIFQEVALVIIKAAEKDEKVEYFTTWAFEITRRKTLEYLRKNKSSKTLNLPNEEMENLVFRVSSNHLSDTSLTNEKYTALIDCIKEMPEKNRTMIKQKYNEGRSIEEIAEQTQKSQSAVYKALTKIRIALGDCINRKVVIGGKE